MSTTQYKFNDFNNNFSKTVDLNNNDVISQIWKEDTINKKPEIHKIAPQIQKIENKPPKNNFSIFDSKFEDCQDNNFQNLTSTRKLSDPEPYQTDTLPFLPHLDFQSQTNLKVQNSLHSQAQIQKPIETPYTYNPNLIHNTNKSSSLIPPLPQTQNSTTKSSSSNNQIIPPLNIFNPNFYHETPSNTNMYKEICELIWKPTFIETAQKVACNIEQLSQPNVCEHITREACKLYNQNHEKPSDTLASIPTKSASLDEILTRNQCTKIHFRKVFGPTTQAALGQCSFLNLCHRADQCKYIHYEQEEDFSEEVKKLEEDEIFKKRSESDTKSVKKYL